MSAFSDSEDRNGQITPLCFRSIYFNSFAASLLMALFSFGLVLGHRYRHVIVHHTSTTYP